MTFLTWQSAVGACSPVALVICSMEISPCETAGLSWLRQALHMTIILLKEHAEPSTIPPVLLGFHSFSSLIMPRTNAGWYQKITHFSGLVQRARNNRGAIHSLINWRISAKIRTWCLSPLPPRCSSREVRTRVPFLGSLF